MAASPAGGIWPLVERRRIADPVVNQLLAERLRPGLQQRELLAAGVAWNGNVRGQRRIVIHQLGESSDPDDAIGRGAADPGWKIASSTLNR